MGAAKPKESAIKRSVKLYMDLRTVFEEFFKSRLDFVIEKSLNEIELRKFLEQELD